MGREEAPDIFGKGPRRRGPRAYRGGHIYDMGCSSGGARLARCGGPFVPERPHWTLRGPRARRGAKRLSMGNWSRCGPRAVELSARPGLSAPRVFSCGELCLRKSSALSARRRRSAPARRGQGRRLRRRRLVRYASTLDGQGGPGKALRGKGVLAYKGRNGNPADAVAENGSFLTRGRRCFSRRQGGEGRGYAALPLPFLPARAGRRGNGGNAPAVSVCFRAGGVNRARPRRCFPPRPPPSLGRP